MVVKEVRLMILAITEEDDQHATTVSIWVKDRCFSAGGRAGARTYAGVGYIEL